MKTIGDTITTAMAKLARVRRVRAAQRALDGDIGQLAIAKCFGRPMDDVLKARLKRLAEKGLADEGHKGIVVEVIYHPPKEAGKGGLVEFAAHAEDRK